MHTESATLWNPASDSCLSIAVHGAKDEPAALRFTREANDNFSVSASFSDSPRQPKYDNSRFQKERQDIWKPIEVKKAERVTAGIELRALPYKENYGRGNLAGLNGDAITELLNTIGRIGVIDDGLVGSNGWYSGYICLHEPWISQVGGVLGDENYQQANAKWLDYVREHGIKPDGMVMSRWYYNDGDAEKGTYDPVTGFYEAQWGRLMDSQTSYVTNVAEQFELSGDKDWLQRQKQSCEAALAYLLTRDTNHNHLVEMANSLTSQRRSSDWLDIVWASYENAFVNAQLYGALNKWAFDESLLGDAAKAKEYTDFAAALKESFNKPISEGGFWNPDKGWYVYWRDADGKTHGDNLTVPINLTAICEGICDDPARVKQLLGTIETKMNAESLLSWPACFESYQPGEGMDDKFPKYENGDIFLAWAGFGVRAYAGYDPTIALKYVKKIAAQYDKDGLAFQRYLRANGQGAGDDILANNCNVITGLYRDVYGIQPRYNRLFISPHLVHELDGTVLNYPYHGERLKIGLSVGDYSVADGGLVVKSDVPFGVQFKNHEATLFAVRSNDPAFSVHARSTDSLSAEIIDWSASNTFKLTAGANGAQAHLTFYGLLKGHTYHLMKNGAAVATMTGESPTATVDLRSKETASFELQPS